MKVGLNCMHMLVLKQKYLEMLNKTSRGEKQRSCKKLLYNLIIKPLLPYNNVRIQEIDQREEKSCSNILMKRIGS